MSKFFKNFKKFVKNSRQDRIYKHGLKLPDTPENLKTYGIPLYGMHIDEVIKKIETTIEKPQERKQNIKTKYRSQGKVKSNKYSRHKKVLSTKKESISLEDLKTTISGTLLFAGLVMISVSDYRESQELAIPIRNQMHQFRNTWKNIKLENETFTPPINWELEKIRIIDWNL